MLVLYFMLFLIYFVNIWSINVDYFIWDELQEDFVELTSYNIYELDDYEISVESLNSNIFNPDDYDIIITSICIK